MELSRITRWRWIRSLKKGNLPRCHSKNKEHLLEFLGTKRAKVRALQESGMLSRHEVSHILCDDVANNAKEYEQAALARYELALEKAFKQYRTDLEMVKRRRSL